ncbi:palmitoyl-acyl carrier protein thioesterase, chloroplastic-like [Phoenix dactylifera]|uniref:Acyl-[acyl-carrier-protein] hydrolase n=1 Tax=Phoenix dactylifera TaxID=42345 RepID=A0A8B7BXY7_PHODC|nr:palmitoyl-acyl carrier protein thioesterase, chloroplastic-like [Phoenix dactylifera]
MNSRFLLRKKHSLFPLPSSQYLHATTATILNTMASQSYAFFHPPKCSAAREDGPRNNNPNKGSSIKINGTSAAIAANIACPAFPSPASVTKSIPIKENRQNIPTEKQTVDAFRQGLIIEGGVRYRQTLVIRSYEVGPDKTATLEAILNLLQETALNHVWMSGLLGDGFGATHGMIRNNLIWVVTRMHVQVDEYPIWGEVVEIDTWVGRSGKNGMRRDWLIQNRLTGQTFARATSTWVMMNQQTRRLSKMPEEVRDEISPWFIERCAIKEEVPEKIIKLDDSAKYVDSNLKPKRSDLDMNHHVNNVKYVRWMLETIPDIFLENHELSSIILEYRRECGSSDVVQSVCEPDEDSIPRDDNINILTGYSLASEILDDCGLAGTFDKWPTRYTHLLQIEGKQRNEEIVRGRTTWRKKLSNTLT